MRSDFILAALRTFAKGDERLAIYGTDEEPIAMAVMGRSSRLSWQSFQPSQLPLGALVCHESQRMEEALQRLLPSLPGLALMAALTQQDPELLPRPAEARRLRTIDYLETARVQINVPFDSYWAARGKNLRTNVKRQLARLAHDNVAFRLDVVEDSSDVRPALDDYGRLEGSGWKVSTGTAVSVDNAQGLFYTSMLEAFCRAGKGSIYRLIVDGRVAAADLCIHDGDVTVILKTAYDESLSSLSPATLLRHQYFRLLFDRGVKRIEFYGKVMEWHRRWTDDVRMLYHVNVYRSALLRRLHARSSAAERIA
jgi:CelD/BcsL family acetyltransferase involved in cellulose biosynthesis